MKSWFSSAFESDLNEGKNSSQTTTRNKRSSTRASSQSKPSGASLDKCPSLISNARPYLNTDQKEELSFSLLEKYEPRKCSDLIVNKNKIAEVSKLLDKIIENKNASIVLFDGPNGCGKTVI
jgi:CRISPR/Cas system-associated endonuclease/helicase Cas3